MRRLLCGLALLVVCHQAHAADPAADLGGPWLRGSNVYEPGTPVYPRWDGLYVGAQAGYSAANFDFAQATQPLIAFILRESALENTGGVSRWAILGKDSTSRPTFGGFVGFNTQWDDVIAGIELNYNFGSLLGSSSGSLTRVVTPGDSFSYRTTVSSSASMKILDYGTFRGRAGYAFGSLLPYAMLGIAVGRADITRSATVGAIITDANGNQSFFGPPTLTETQLDKVVYGFSGGLGIDICLLSNVFLRAEWEYVQFVSLNGIKANTNNLRAGLGLKF